MKTIILTDTAYDFLCHHIIGTTDTRLIESELSNRDLATLDTIASALNAAKES